MANPKIELTNEELILLIWCLEGMIKKEDGHFKQILENLKEKIKNNLCDTLS